MSQWKEYLMSSGIEKLTNNAGRNIHNSYKNLGLGLCYQFGTWQVRNIRLLIEAHFFLGTDWASLSKEQTASSESKIFSALSEYPKYTSAWLELHQLFSWKMYPVLDPFYANTHAHIVHPSSKAADAFKPAAPHSDVLKWLIKIVLSSSLKWVPLGGEEDLAIVILWVTQ